MLITDSMRCVDDRSSDTCARSPSRCTRRASAAAALICVGALLCCADSPSRVRPCACAVQVKSPKWFPLLFTVCFMHSVLQERCKFGSLGWTVPYEFNHSDLTASLLFVQKYMYSIQAALKRSGELAWPSIRYMVCEVMYGGRVTDAHDRRLLNAYGSQWLDSKIFKKEFRFIDEYAIPDVSSAKGPVPASVALPRILEHVSALPLYDSPELFGLHINAAQAFSTMSATALLRGIAATIPGDSVSQAAAEDGGSQVASMIFKHL